MPDESTTSDLVELSYRRLDAINRRDLEAVVNFFAANAVWDMSPIDMGVLAGHAAIRNALKTWWETFPAIVSELDEVLDLGNGVVLQAVTQRGRPTGSTGDIRRSGSFGGELRAYGAANALRGGRFGSRAALRNLRRSLLVSSLGWRAVAEPRAARQAGLGMCRRSA